MSKEQIADEILKEFKIRKIEPNQSLTGIMLSLLLGKLNPKKLKLVDGEQMKQAIIHLAEQGLIAEDNGLTGYCIVLTPKGFQYIN